MSRIKYKKGAEWEYCDGIAFTPDHDYNPTSPNAQSGVAVQQAIDNFNENLPNSYVPIEAGKIPMQYIPATATMDIFEITAESELTSLTAQRGDLAELIEVVGDERTITKTWQLLGTDASIRENWIVWGTSYAVQAGNATSANYATNAGALEGQKFQYMTYTDYQNLPSKDKDTIYMVEMGV